MPYLAPNQQWQSTKCNNMQQVQCSTNLITYITEIIITTKPKWAIIREYYYQKHQTRKLRVQQRQHVSRTNLQSRLQDELNQWNQSHP